MQDKKSHWTVALFFANCKNPPGPGPGPSFPMGRQELD